MCCGGAGADALGEGGGRGGEGGGCGVGAVVMEICLSFVQTSDQRVAH